MHCLFEAHNINETCVYSEAHTYERKKIQSLQRIEFTFCSEQLQYILLIYMFYI